MVSPGRPQLASAKAEMDDYPLDEARVMRGDDDRIKPAVASAIAMGFGEADATEAAKRVIVAFPGRADVEALVVDALLADSGGGARVRAPEDHAPRVRGRRAGAPERDCERFFRSRDRSDRRTFAGRAAGEEAPRRRGGGWQRQSAGRSSSTTDDGGQPNDANDSMRNDGNDLMRRLAAERRARDAARGEARRPAVAAVPRSTAGDAPNARAAAAAAAGRGRAADLPARRRGGGAAAVSSAFGGSGIIDALLAGTSEL